MSKMLDERERIAGLPLSVGRHVLLDLQGVAIDRMRQAGATLEWLRGALERRGFHPVGEVGRDFSGGGATGLVLLTESHASFHTYPELGFVACDVFACGNVDLPGLVDELVEYWGAERVECREVERGVGVLKHGEH